MKRKLHHYLFCGFYIVLAAAGAVTLSFLIPHDPKINFFFACVVFGITFAFDEIRNINNLSTKKISPGDIIYFELQEGQMVLACVIENCGKQLKIQGMGQYYRITHIPIGKVVALYKPHRNWVGKE
jgi:hypothetical protein